MISPDAAENELWVRYRSGSDESARDSLFLHYVPWATAIARSVHYRIRAYHADRDDFIQNATIGLLEAMSRYDHTRGVAFRAYAQPRVRGAVFNGLRAIIGDRTVGTDEIRLQSLRENIGDDAFSTVVDSIVGLSIGYLLDEAAQYDGENLQDAFSYARRAEIDAHLASAMACLPPRLRMIVQAHYFQFIPFQDIAAQLGITKGRVSQLHRSALVSLRNALRGIV